MSQVETEALQQAVLEEDEEAVRALLRVGVDPNPAGVPFYDVPLVDAVSQGSLGIARLLVEAGANLEVTSQETGLTPLVLAVSDGAGAIARFLLERGAQVNVAGDVSGCFGRQSPLILAVKHGDTELTRLLLARGADPNRFGEFHGRPLHFAARDDRLEAIDLLLDHGADPWFRDEDCDWTALDLALSRNERQAARLLYQRMDQQHPNYLGSTLHALAGLGDAEGIEAVLDSGTPAALCDGTAKTALHWAVSGCQRLLELSKIILEASGHPIAPTVAGRTSVVDLLLVRGANIDALGAACNTPLHDALSWGELGLAEHLVRAGANVRLVDQAGWTPLLLAARAGAHPALISELFRRGAVFSDAQGPWNALTYAAHRGSLPTVLALIEHGVPVNGAGWSPLRAAVDRGNVEIVKALLAKGADPNVRDNDGKTPADCGMF